MPSQTEQSQRLSLSPGFFFSVKQRIGSAKVPAELMFNEPGVPGSIPPRLDDTGSSWASSDPSCWAQCLAFGSASHK